MVIDANRRRSGNTGGARLAVLGCFAVAAVTVSAVFFLRSSRSERKAPESALAESATIKPATESRSLPVSNAAPATTAMSQRAAPTASQPVTKQQPLDGSRQLVTEMWELSGIHGPVSKEQAEKFKQNLERLIKQGAASIPAIRDFLQKNTDTYFSQVEGGDQLGYSSMRASMFDALKQIGGPEAQTAMLEAVHTTALPSELLELAKNLDNEAPGQYRDEILNAARDALSMASANQLGTNVELGPAFRMLQTFGNANTIADAGNKNPGSLYNAISLANLPDGQGLPSLVQLAQNSGPDASAQAMATVMIAQLAAQNSSALEALVQMAQNGQIRNNVWEKLAPILGGDQYQISQNFGPGAEPNAGFTIVNGVSTPDQINQRIALIDQFLGIVPADSAAAAALSHQRELLAAKLSN